jgi:hypothetical protein
MIATLVYAFFLLCVVGVLLWAVFQLLPMLPLPEPFARVLYVILTVICCLIVIYILYMLVTAALGGGGGVRPFRLGMLPLFLPAA